MTKPPEEADDFSVGENASRIIHMDEDDRDDDGSGDEGVDDGLSD